MAQFEATLINSAGKTTQAVVDAPDQASAEKILRRRGKLLSVKRRRSFSLSPGMNATDRYTFLARMSSMLGGRLGTAEALRLIIANFSGPIRRAAIGLLDKIESGMDLPKAMEQDRKNFPAALVALIKAGAQSGETWKALKDAADFEYHMQTIRKGSNKDLFGALFSFFLAGGLIVVSTHWLGPKLLNNPLFSKASGVDVDWIITSADIITGIMIVFLIVVAGFVWLATAGKQLMPLSADKIIMRVPFYKDIVLARNNYATLYKLGLLIKAGVRIEDSLRLTEEGAPKGALRDDLKRALAAVRTGKPWASVMQTLHPTDRAALSSSANREDIARTMDILAIQYRDLYIQRMSTFAPAMQVLAALFLSLAGAIMFGMTMLPMLQLARNMSLG